VQRDTEKPRDLADLPLPRLEQLRFAAFIAAFSNLIPSWRIIGRWKFAGLANFSISFEIRRRCASGDIFFCDDRKPPMFRLFENTRAAY
jgi:hypothetical protein